MDFESDSSSFVSDDESESDEDEEAGEACRPIFKNKKEFLFGQQKGQGPQPVIKDSPSPVLPKETKDKKRPRDKILRDPKLGRRAMDVRKRRAFLGYTYRRPEAWWFGEGTDDMKTGLGATKGKHMSRELPKEFMIH